MVQLVNCEQSHKMTDCVEEGTHLRVDPASKHKNQIMNK